jgi:N,N'-diacetyllegionaminate synthase
MFKLKKPYLIAEIGSSHMGNLKLAYLAIAEAKKGGADCVKFQIYDEKTIVHPKLRTLSYIKHNKYKYQAERFAKMKITLNDIKKLYDFSKKKKIDFCVTPFDPNLVKKISKYVKFFKVASGDLNYYQLLKEIKKTKKIALVSTGASKYKDIKNSLKYLNKKKVAILHCVSSYPTKKEDINLSNILELKNNFNIEVGFSDHTQGIDATVASVFFGAKIIEKHFVPSRGSSKSADYPLSINYRQMKNLRKKIDDAFSMIGEKKDRILKCEKYGEKNLKRSIYSSQVIKKGNKLNKDNIICLRPYIKSGVKIENFYDVVKKKAKRTINKYKLIKKGDLT